MKCTKALNVVFSSAFLFLVSLQVKAEVLNPDPTQSNEQHWDSILGSGSYADYAGMMRVIPSVLLFISGAWVIFGLFRAAFIEESISITDFFVYAGRFMLIVTASIVLIVHQS